MGRHCGGVQGFFWITATPSACRPVLQASEGVPVRFFTKLDQLIEFYKKENMGLVTHLQYPVPLEEEDAGDELEEETGREG
ncbi:hypothetical protein MC885_016639 [Smutsia gigantea]|nr:hypothetical protein MC885_016639 [Smutsia gigantea]